ncbi:hypothetical protein KM043_001022, partial [Ampulex compressa]
MTHEFIVMMKPTI